MMRGFYMVVFLFLLVGSSKGQDPIYSQFYLSPSLINPAFAGNTDGPLVSVIYRNQWPGIANVYNTFSVTYDQRWNKKSGIGLYITSDNAGDGALKSTKGAAIYSYNIRIIDDVYIKGGIDAGFGFTSLDRKKLVFLDNLDPQYGQMSPGGVTYQSAEVLDGKPVKSYIDISSGVLLYSSKYYLGVSFEHLNTPEIDYVVDQTGPFGQLPMRFSVHAGGQFYLEKHNKKGEDSFLSPNVIFAKQQNFWQLTAGAYVSIRQIFGGFWYRHAAKNSDAVIASIGVRKGVFRISYSFDYTVSGLTINAGGSHEIGLVLNFDSEKKKYTDYSDCLMLFR